MAQFEPSMSDWADHLTTIFPEVRLKQFLEMRGADGGQWRRICGMPALWVGIFYDSVALDAAWDLVKDWTAEERQAMRDAVPRQGFKTPFRKTTVHELAHRMLEISSAGLKRRAELDWRRHERGRFPQSAARTGGARLHPRRGAAEELSRRVGPRSERICSRNIISSDPIHDVRRQTFALGMPPIATGVPVGTRVELLRAAIQWGYCGRRALISSSFAIFGVGEGQLHRFQIVVELLHASWRR